MRFGILLSALGLVLFSAPAMAQDDAQYIYEPITIEKLSQFYWTINKMDINNDLQIDNFLRVNECDIYNDYYHNEFEWKRVRESGRTFIGQHKPSFPTRFEFMQPIRLTDYDFKTGKFGILKGYQVNGVRRFEVYAQDTNANVCGNKDELPDYQRGLAIELNRPVVLTELAVEPKTAEQFIASKTDKFKSLDDESENKKTLYNSRDAYIVFKFYGYSYTGEFEAQKDRKKLAGTLATLEGFDVYGDRDRKLLLHSENYLIKRELSDMEKKLIEEYEASKRPQETAPAQPAAPPPVATP